MNSHLIPVFQADNYQLLCNARDLHGFLEVGARFNDWIARRIAEYQFVEGEDYLLFGCSDLSNQSSGRGGDFYSDLSKSTEGDFSPNPAKSRMGRPSIEYHLTLDMAKELAMIENNAMGRRVRRYFIQRERQAMELLQQQATEVQPIEQVRKRIKDTPRFRYLLILQEQSRTLARELACCEHPRERFNLHCALRQVNNALGLPTEPLEVWNGSQALTSDKES